MIRILHTADWQIGKPFGGFEPERRGELRAERFAVVKRIAALAAERRCDAVVVAGDAFDDNTTGDRDLNRTLSAMAAFAGPWIMLPGNHDASLSASVWTRLAGFDLPKNLFLATVPEPIEIAGGRAVVLPAPLTRRHEGADVTDWFDRAETPRDAIRIGLAHGSLTGRLPEAAESENPIAEDRARTARLDYLALGDWHGFLPIADRTVYAGTPEPDRYRANEPGHVAIVAIDHAGAPPQIEKVTTARFDWRRLDLRLDGGVAALDEALDGLPKPSDTLVDLRLAGSVSLRERVALDEALARWAARLFDLRVDDRGLVDEPADVDLDEIDVGGFVRTAIERLRDKAADPADPERAAAQMALRMAYVEHRRLGPEAGGRSGG